jgi:hypothetical protein
MATRAAVARLTDDHVAKLSALVLEMEQETSREDYAKLLLINRAFHLTLYEVWGRRFLCDSITGFGKKVSDIGLFMSICQDVPDRHLVNTRRFFRPFKADGRRKQCAPSETISGKRSLVYFSHLTKAKKPNRSRAKVSEYDHSTFRTGQPDSGTKCFSRATTVDRLNIGDGGVSSNSA